MPNPKGDTPAGTHRSTHGTVSPLTFPKASVYPKKVPRSLRVYVRVKAADLIPAIRRAWGPR